MAGPLDRLGTIDDLRMCIDYRTKDIRSIDN